MSVKAKKLINFVFMLQIIILLMNEIEAMCHIKELQKHTVATLQKLHPNKIQEMINYIDGQRLDRIKMILEINNNFKHKCSQISMKYSNLCMFDIENRNKIHKDRNKLKEKYLLTIEAYLNTINEQKDLIKSLKDQLLKLKDDDELNSNKINSLKHENILFCDEIKGLKIQNNIFRNQVNDLIKERDAEHNILDKIIKKKRKH